MGNCLSFFENTFLGGASFKRSHFNNTLFHNANLKEASFCKAEGYAIDPRVNDVRKAKFSVPEVLNLLSGVDILISDEE
ncbi:MAG: pentapeptide repeat-containing protein [Bacteroidetes bacterium]|nr:pentapeptide repeat-containing protein [Bacteroidota bacterium]